MAYSAAEYVDMVLIYGECHRNANQALRTYRDRYGETRRCPTNPRVITRAVQRIRDNRRIDPTTDHEGVVTRQIPTWLDERILRYFQLNPTSSVRRAARLFNVHRNAVHKVLKRVKWHPFKFRKVQALLPRDRVIRMGYCRWLQEKIAESPTFLSYILWTDESTFTRNGMWNRHNYHYWSPVNPHVCRESAHQYRFTLNVWAGIHGNSIIGPEIIDGNLNRARFLELLDGPVSDYLAIISQLHGPRWMERTWFQMDGAPAHSVVEARERLNRMFNERWIGRYGPRRWPARSPDLTPLDFFLWGFVKDEVYAQNVDTVEELRERIEMAFEKLRTMTSDGSLLQRVRNNMQRRLTMCIQNNGGHFEHLKI